MTADVPLFNIEPGEAVKRGRVEQPHKGYDRSETPDGLFEVETPPYHVPTLAEVRNTRSNGLTAVSTFSGCGGSSTGLKMAGWHIPYAVEFIPPARDSYLANYPDTTVDARDIRVIKADDILDATGLKRGELDLFEGSPPCSSFSRFNVSKAARYGSMKVKAYSENVKQTTDDLFDEWLRLVDGLYPRAVLAENVTGLLEPDAVDFFQHILARLDELGYAVRTGVFNASHYGAATQRKRLIFTGVRRDAGQLPMPPERLPFTYTLGDALATLPVDLPADEWENAQPSERLAKGWGELAPGQEHFWMKNLMKCAPSRPMQGVTAGAGAYSATDPMHWSECRKFTPTELKWVFGFPADYILTGKPAQRYERVGRAVSPPLYRAHGRVLAEALGG